MMFLKYITLKSPFRSEEIVRRLGKMTAAGHRNGTHKNRFEGIVDGDWFRIYPTFNYQSMYRFRPEIHGFLKEEENDGTCVMLTFTLSAGIKFLLIAGLILTVSLMVYLFLVPSENHFLVNWKVIAVVIPLMSGLLWGDFNYKVSRILRVLKHRFRATDAMQEGSAVN